MNQSVRHRTILLVSVGLGRRPVREYFSGPPSADVRPEIRTEGAEGWHLGANSQLWFVTGSTLSDGTSQSCGYHWWVGEAEGAIVAVSDGGSMCTGDTVGTLAHEYAEAATDPDNHDGNIASVSSSDGEIADVCARGGRAVSPVGPLPMRYQPGVGCSWGDWAPSEVWGGGIAAMAPPSSWTQCTGAIKCAAWLFYPPGDPPDSRDHRVRPVETGPRWSNAPGKGVVWSGWQMTPVAHA